MTYALGDTCLQGSCGPEAPLVLFSALAPVACKCMHSLGAGVRFHRTSGVSVAPHVLMPSGVLLRQVLWDLQGMMSRITGGSRLSATGDVPPAPPQRIATAAVTASTPLQPTATSSPRYDLDGILPLWTFHA